jgi:hypothetical protein
VRKFAQRLAYGSVENTVRGSINWLHFALDGRCSRYGISGFKKITSQDGTETKITDTEGKVILKILSNPSSALLETSIFKAFVEYGKQVTLSEYAVGVTGALSETQYTPKGKRTIERGEHSKPLVPFNDDEYRIVGSRLQMGIMEITPRIPSRIPLQPENLVVNSPAPSLLGLEKIIRSSIR